jgi:hypothetical protein
MTHVADNPHRHLGRVVENGQCVRFVQVVSGIGHTSTWRQGPSVRDNPDIVPGTVIATFNANGRYANDTTGRSHAAIYLAQDEHGVRVIDQWVGRTVPGQGVQERLIRFRGGVGKPVDDGDAYFIVETMEA